MTRNQRPGADRRRARRTRPSRTGWWIAGGVGLALLVAGLLVWRQRASGDDTAAAAVGCSAMEQLAYHIHVHVTILAQGQPILIPANTGIRSDCISWLHTHDVSGVVH